MRRRAFLAKSLAAPLLATPLALAAPAIRAAGSDPRASAAAVDYPPVVAGTPLAFPRDHGSHPAFRTEWWYVTGLVRDASGNDYGVQVTFFRTRTGLGEDNPSAFAPRQILFAHAALADPRRGRLLHDQRAARAGLGLAEAREDTTGVWIGDWSLALADGRYVARIAAREFALDLAFAPTQAVLPQGERGYSRKGPDPRQASFYYSRPQLTASGRIGVDGRSVEVAGTAWLDHEWSSGIMAPEAVGWDWVGLNLDDGGALMAFRMRARGSDGSGGGSGSGSRGALWAGGTLREANGSVRTFGPDAIRFRPLRWWRSPRTEAAYPVALAVEVGGVEYVLQPLFDDQELDSRASTGTIYWEGAVRATVGGRAAGRGYLELTGYWKPLQL